VNEPELLVARELYAPAVQAVEALLRAIEQQDREALQTCYHESVSYSTPLFPDLRKEMVLDAWDLIYDGMESFAIEHEFIFADERKAQLAWRCTYQRNQRHVVFPGMSTFSLWDDKIVRQVDEWAFASWARRQFGVKAWLFSWSKRFQRHCQDTAVAQLHTRTTGYR
jgi:SnoaL-like domain